MAMFDDPKKELEKLEKQLLKEEEWFDEELEFAKSLIGDEPGQKSKKKKTAQRPLDETQVYRTNGGKKTKSAEPQVRNYANGYGKKTTQNIYDYDMDEDDYSDAPAKKSQKTQKKEKGIKGLVILACLETLGIVGVVAYWLLFLL